MTHSPQILWLFISMLGACHIIYSILYRQKVTLHNRLRMQDNNYILIDETNFFREQLYAGIIGGSLMILTALSCTLVHLVHPLVLNYWIAPCSPLFIHLVSALFIARCYKKGYIASKTQ